MAHNQTPQVVEVTGVEIKIQCGYASHITIACLQVPRPHTCSLSAMMFV